MWLMIPLKLKKIYVEKLLAICVGYIVIGGRNANVTAGLEGARPAAQDGKSLCS